MSTLKRVEAKTTLRRSFAITLGLSEGYGATAKLHTREEVVQAALVYMKAKAADGKLDDIRIYGYALSADQVKKMYNTTSPTQPIDTSLVGHWTFDGSDIQGATAIDRSSFGNNGTITGTTKTIGKLGQGLSFNGTSDYVDIASQVNMLPVYRYNTTYSVSFWMKGPTNQGSAKLYAEAAANGPGQQFLWIESDDNGASGKIQILIKNQAGTLVLNALSTGTAFDNTWHHVAWVDSNGVAKLYIDSTQDATNFNYTRSGTFTGINTTAFGAQLLDGYATGFVSVVLDDVRVYNRALSSVEIASLYNIGR